MLEDIEETLITEEEIEAKVAEIGRQISRDYENRDLLIVNVLKGSVVFLADLMRRITLPLSVDFMATSSYGSATESSGVVRLLKDLEESVAGKDVLVVEDIIDTGLTLNYLLKNLKERGPKTLTVCTLLDKSVRRIAETDLAYKGFDIPDLFVVGYGLDFDQKYRNLPFIGVLKASIINPAGR
ncbi:MAG: hypoxanthine phosphoribosyltransferase [Terriglobia bacterium]